MRDCLQNNNCTDLTSHTGHTTLLLYHEAASVPFVGRSLGDAFKEYGTKVVAASNAPLGKSLTYTSFCVRHRSKRTYTGPALITVGDFHRALEDARSDLVCATCAQVPDNTRQEYQPSFVNTFFVHRTTC